MVERINLLLQAKNITARQFAEEIGIQPSGMSHILSGRNNPSLDFVMKVMKRWPEVNINWLMFDKGEMFASLPLNVTSTKATPVTSVSNTSTQAVEPDLFSQFDVSEVETPTKVQDQTLDEPANISDLAESIQDNRIDAARVEESTEKLQLDENRINETPSPVAHVQQNLVASTNIATSVKKISKIVVLYDDHSFAEYFPE